MIFHFIISFGLVAVYAYLMHEIAHGWDETDHSFSYRRATKNLRFTIIIVARNEAANISKCLLSITQNEYPSKLYEIILVDDHSDDKTKEIANDLQISNLTILDLKDFVNQAKVNSFKKKAINYALQIANGDWIVMTDADCTVQNMWLSTLNEYLNAYKHKKFVSMPVAFTEGDQIIERFQSLEMMGSMALTAAGIHDKTYFLANGANMAFDRREYQKKPIHLNEKYASGDDVFMVQAFAKHEPETIGFIKNKNAIVETETEKKWSSFRTQRKRWASKTKAYFKTKMTIIGGVVFGLSLSIMYNFFLLIVVGDILAFILAFQIFCKVIVDYLFLNKLTNFFGQKDHLRFIIPLSFIHTTYHIYMGFMAIFARKYKWKGRKVS